MQSTGEIVEPLFAEAGDVMSLKDAQALGLDPADFPDDGDAGSETKA